MGVNRKKRKNSPPLTLPRQTQTDSSPLTEPVSKAADTKMYTLASARLPRKSPKIPILKAQLLPPPTISQTQELLRIRITLPHSQELTLCRLVRSKGFITLRVHHSGKNRVSRKDSQRKLQPCKGSTT